MQAPDRARSALVVVDVLNHFDHADGDELLDAFASRTPAMAAAIGEARRRGVPVVYANDDLCGRGDPAAVLRQALGARADGSSRASRRGRTSPCS